jgi:NAD(P)-dependent dehydrogenase (short-subunit alcohol dehydrogenase family)
MQSRRETPANTLQEFQQQSSFSRRLFLQMSAAGLAAGPLSAQTADSQEWTVADIPSLTGRRVVITGGNGYPQEDRSGLGYHVALALARAGADVTIASRKQDRGQEAVRRITEEVPGAAVRFERFDLTDLSSIKALVSRLEARGKSLDLLVNNAGVMGRMNREVSVDGFERVLATNTIGHFALTAHLLPMLRNGRNTRVVWVGSSRMSRTLPFDDLQLERTYQYAAAYDNSKLANLLLVMEMHRRSVAAGWGISVLAAHPGVARTNLIPDGPGLDSIEGNRFKTMTTMFQPASQGAISLTFAATAPQATAGNYYGPTMAQGAGATPGLAAIPAAAQDQGSATRLWSMLEALTKVPFA